MTKIADFLPILTTLLAAYFTWEISKQYLKWKTKYLLWWTLGVLNFGLGTLSESLNIIVGWNEINLKFWYITGALFGGFTLSQGSVYLLRSNKLGDRLTLFWMVYILIASICVIMTPVVMTEEFNGKLTGASFEWEWVRYFTPLINTYSFVLIFGGGIYSANEYFNHINKESRFLGCIYISFGALLISIGGFYSRMGYMEVLFIAELVGLGLIYWGYRQIIANINEEKF